MPKSKSLLEDVLFRIQANLKQPRIHEPDAKGSKNFRGKACFLMAQPKNGAQVDHTYQLVIVVEAFICIPSLCVAPFQRHWQFK